MGVKDESSLLDFFEGVVVDLDAALSSSSSEASTE